MRLLLVFLWHPWHHVTKGNDMIKCDMFRSSFAYTRSRNLWIEFGLERTYKINLKWASSKRICYLHLPPDWFSSVSETGSQTQGLPAPV